MSFDVSELFDPYGCRCERHAKKNPDPFVGYNCHGCRTQLDTFKYFVFDLNSHYCNDSGWGRDAYYGDRELAYEKGHSHFCEKCYKKYLRDLITQAQQRLDSIGR